MADTAKIIGPTLLTAAAATMYTTPGATQFVWKFLRIANTSGTAATVTVSIGADAAATRIFGGETVPANGSITFDLWLPLAATTIIQAYSGTNGVCTFTAGGVEIT